MSIGIWKDATPLGNGSSTGPGARQCIPALHSQAKSSHWRPSTRLIMTRKALFHLFTLLSIGTFALTSCGGSGGGSSAGKTKLAFITNGAADFWIYCEAGIRAAEREHDDIAVDFKIGDGTAAKQKQMANDLIVRGVKALSISPTSPKDQVEMINQWAEKTNVLCVDSDAPASNRITYLGTDNVEAGRQAGLLVKEAIPQGGKIMVYVGLGDAQNAVERYQGVREALAGSNVEVLGLMPDEMKQDKARRNVEDTLTKHPDIAGMVGLWSYNAPAILKAVESAGKADQVKIIAFDEDPITLAAIDEGRMFGTVCQDPYKFGYDSVKLMRELTVGGKSAEDAGIPANKQMIVPTKLIRKGEGMQYLEYCNGLKDSLK